MQLHTIVNVYALNHLNFSDPVHEFPDQDRDLKTTVGFLYYFK